MNPTSDILPSLRLAAAVIALGALAPGALLAQLPNDDVRPPSTRSLAYATTQVWGWETDADPANASSFSNPFGTPTATIEDEPLFATGWISGDDPVFNFSPVRKGYWDIARGYIDFAVPTGTASLLYPDMLIQVQVTYLVALNDIPTVSITGATLASSEVVQREVVDSIVQWRTLVQNWYLPTPSHPSILVRITGNADDGSTLDTVILDLVPEPSTYAMAFGALALGFTLVRRRLGR